MAQQEDFRSGQIAIVDEPCRNSTLLNTTRWAELSITPVGRKRRAIIRGIGFDAWGAVRIVDTLGCSSTQQMHWMGDESRGHKLARRASTRLYW